MWEVTAEMMPLLHCIGLLSCMGEYGLMALLAVVWSILLFIAWLVIKISGAGD